MEFKEKVKKYLEEDLIKNLDGYDKEYFDRYRDIKMKYADDPKKFNKEMRKNREDYLDRKSGKKKLNEFAIEVGKGMEGKPVIRYYYPGNPKAFRFEELEGERKKEAEKLFKQNKDVFQKLGQGDFSAGKSIKKDEKGNEVRRDQKFDIVSKGDGRYIVNSPTSGIVNKELTLKLNECRKNKKKKKKKRSKKEISRDEMRRRLVTGGVRG